MKGFTLLFASLIVSVMLSISLSIAHVTLTELTLSSAGRDSQLAFYNADTGLECALYHEYKVAGDEDGNSFFKVDGVGGVNIGDLECNEDEPDSLPIPVVSGATTTTSFSINSGEACFDVEVHKWPHETYEYATRVFIESRGYSSCDENNPRRVERGLYVRFIN